MADVAEDGFPATEFYKKKTAATHRRLRRGLSQETIKEQLLVEGETSQLHRSCSTSEHYKRGGPVQRPNHNCASPREPKRDRRQWEEKKKQKIRERENCLDA